MVEVFLWKLYNALSSDTRAAIKMVLRQPAIRSGFVLLLVHHVVGVMLSVQDRLCISCAPICTGSFKVQRVAIFGKDGGDPVSVRR